MFKMLSDYRMQVRTIKLLYILKTVEVNDTQQHFMWFKATMEVEYRVYQSRSHYISDPARSIAGRPPLILSPNALICVVRISTDAPVL